MEREATVHVIDDEPAVRDLFRRLIETASLQVREHISGAAFLEAAKSTTIGCVVTDLRMPGMDGIELLKQLREAGALLPAIIVTGFADIRSTVEGMKLGAVDVLEKPVDPHRLLQTIGNAIAISREADRDRSAQQDVVHRLTLLTHRERELLELIVHGKSNKQIGREMAISVKTVANHRASIMAKMQAANAADLARIRTLAGHAWTLAERATGTHEPANPDSAVASG